MANSGISDGKVAICNAGGGFVYVGAMQGSFPHAMELSKKGYHRGWRNFIDF